MREGKLSKAEMSNAQNAQSGTPKYMDVTAETPGNPSHADQGNGAVPAYIASNPRYWEYR